MKEHAAFLSTFCDHLHPIQTAVPMVAVSTAEGDEWAVEAIVPGPIFVHIPLAVLIGIGLPSR